MKVEESYEMNSDHSPILLTLSENIIEKEKNPILINKHTDWESFRICLELKINLDVSLQSDNELNLEVEKFIKDIQQSAWDNTPVIKNKLKGHNYPREIKTLLNEKRQARKKWHQTRAPQDKKTLNNLTQQLKREIQQLKNESINTYLKKLTNDKSSDYSLWKATKNLNKPIVQQIPPNKKK